MYTSGLPGIYTLSPQDYSPQALGVYIRQTTRAHGIAIKYLCLMHGQHESQSDWISHFFLRYFCFKSYNSPCKGDYCSAMYICVVLPWYILASHGQTFLCLWVGAKDKKVWPHKTNNFKLDPYFRIEDKIHAIYLLHLCLYLCILISRQPELAILLISLAFVCTAIDATLHLSMATSMPLWVSKLIRIKLQLTTDWRKTVCI